MSGPPPLPRRVTVRDVQHSRARKRIAWSVALLALVLVAAFRLDLSQPSAATTTHEPGGK